MKTKTIITILILLAMNHLSAQPGAPIGMKIEDFIKENPNLEKQEYENETTFEKPVSIHGLKDSWGYRFKESKLNWIFFHKYIDKINQTNFDICLNATNRIINDFTKTYGKPDSVATGNTSFVDPYIKRHWGYDVIEAYWKNYKGMKIKVEFTFMGGKGEYNFLVKINYFDKDYPFFD